MSDLSTLPFRSTPFSGDPSLIQPQIPNQIFNATDTKKIYIANTLEVGGLEEYSSSSSSGGGGGGSAVIPGYFVCVAEAPSYQGTRPYTIGGKGIRVLEYGTHTFNIKVTDVMATKFPTTGEVTAEGWSESNIIEVHRWSQPPNSSMTGRSWVADLPREGGAVNVVVDSTYRWITVQARNYNGSSPSGGAHDTAYLQWHNTSDIWLWTFTDNLNLTPEIDAAGYNETVN